MKIPFWEESYKDDNIFTFGDAVNPSIPEIEDLISKSGNIIDIGCGDGRNSLYLADRGFENIEAFDLSENAINKLKRLAEAQKIKINVWVGNLCSFSFEKQYDLIISFGTLHFVGKEDWHNFIMKAKSATAVGGINIIQLFTDKVHASSDIAPFAIGLSGDGEIKELYSDWEIISFSSFVFEEEHHDVPKHQHASNKITARRIK